MELSGLYIQEKCVRKPKIVFFISRKNYWLSKVVLQSWVIPSLLEKYVKGIFLQSLVKKQKKKKKQLCEL